MILDILIVVILILSMVFGYRIGFVRTFLGALGWVASVVLAFLWTPFIRDFLTLNTGLYATIHRTLSERFNGIDRISSDFPGILRDTVDSLIRQAADAASIALSDLLFTVISFLIIIFAVKLVVFVIVLTFSKKNAGGIRGVVDGTAGLCFGFIKGALLVFALLAALIPFLGLSDGGLADTISDWLDSSYFAGSLYNNNFLALILRDFLI